MRFGLLFLVLFPLVSRAQEVVAVFTGTSERQQVWNDVERLHARGLDVSVVLGPGVYLAREGSSGPVALSDEFRVHRAESDRSQRSGADPVQRLALSYIDGLAGGRFDGPTVTGRMDWDTHDCGSGHRSEDEGRDAAPADWACSNGYNSEQLLGTVTASTFFVESNGTVDADLYSWTPAAIEQVKLQVIDAWSIWSYTAALHGETLTAVMDWHEPDAGITVQGHEPILHASTQDHLWLDAIMLNAGRTETGTTAMLKGFAHDRRMLFGTDRSFNCFFAYNPPSQGAASQFTDGKIGYAFLGGPYAQLLYKANGWAVEQIVRVYGHEMAHVFHAFDEYLGSGSNNCSRSFNGRQNLNFQGGACNGGQSCVMVDNSFTGAGATRRWNLCDHTPIHLGWSGTLTPPACIEPIEDEVLGNGSVTFQWAAGYLPPGSSRYLRVVDRSTGNAVHCGPVTGPNSATITLLNGSYEWTISKGVPDVFNGHAGTTSVPGLFQVHAPLYAQFTAPSVPICPGGTVTYTSQSTGGPLTWAWSFPGGDPATYDGPDPPPIQYAHSGSFGASLTLTDATDTVFHEMGTAVTVLGGVPAPFGEDFEEGIFPPAGWSSPVQGAGGVPWTIEGINGCGGSDVSAYVNAYPLSNTWRTVRLVGPLMDLTTMEHPLVRFRYSYAPESSTTTEVLLVSAKDCQGYGVQELMELGGQELATNGGSFVANTPWQPLYCAQWREVVLSLEEFAGAFARLTFDVATRGGQNLWLDDIEVFEAPPVHLRVFLEGPYSATTGLMSDTLRQQGLLPSYEPYTELGCELIGGEHVKVPGPVLAISGTDAIVDWVLVELRSVEDPSVVISRRAALVQRDGDVVDVDGVGPVHFPVRPASYPVCIHHRNHLAVMTAEPVTIGTSGTLIDFGLPTTPAHGVDARRTVEGKALLWCGDVNGDGALRYTGMDNDRDPILVSIGGLVPTATVTGYQREDVNMDGRVKYTGAFNDRDRILLNIGTTPTFVRYQQVP